MSQSPLSLVWQGYRAAAPLMIGVAPFGIVFGALAVNAGMSVLEALGMSVLVLAGSSQFVAAGLIESNTPVLIIVLTTFIINLRHFLYSASLASILRPLSFGWKALLGYMMVDEVYAPVMLKHQEGQLSVWELRWYFVGAGGNLITIWWLTTVIGALVADDQLLPDKLTAALGFTLPLIFTGIVVPQVIGKFPLAAAALSAGITAVILAPLPYKLGLMVAALVGIVVGVISEEKSKQKAALPEMATGQVES